MEVQRPTSFGEALRRALHGKGMTQARLAEELQTDPGQVSRWATGKTTPQPATLTRLTELLGVDLAPFVELTAPPFELYVSAPITGLTESEIPGHHDSVSEVVAVLEPIVGGVYWPGSQIRGLSNLAAADLATEHNIKALSGCSAFLYLQFTDIVRPSSALIELGIALGRRLKTTLIVRRGIDLPYMMEGFQGVAASLTGVLPKARIYEVRSVAEAREKVSQNGRELLGLA